MNTKITDVFFDLDHTLWDFEKNSGLALAAIFQKQGIAIDLDAFLKQYVPVNLKYWELYRTDQVSQSELRFGRLKETFDLLGYAIADEQVVFLSEEYIRYLPDYNHLFEGTVELLDYLKPKYKLHIITNGFADVQGRKLDNSNISRYFETVTNSELAGVKKPNPIIFEYALELAQAKKESSIMIGDCLIADVQGALDCGLDAIYFNEQRTAAPETIKQVFHLLELKKHL